MPVTDVGAFLGAYPFRHLGSAASPGWLLAQMDRLGIDAAWVGYLPTILHSDPAPGNRELEKVVARVRDRLEPVPTVNPEQARWPEDVDAAALLGAPAIRLFPQYQGVATAGPESRAVAASCVKAGLVVVLSVRLEDLRQRHPLDQAGELAPHDVRALIRVVDGLRLVITHADRTFIEEVHFGLTPEEADRVVWDISWLWGPPDDHLQHLVRTVGPERFVFGTGTPLRIPDAAVVKLELSDLEPDTLAGIRSGHLERWLGRRDGGQ
jgi:predicted TIM-barrel fold metal-dependent hydrolase